MRTFALAGAAAAAAMAAQAMSVCAVIRGSVEGIFGKDATVCGPAVTAKIDGLLPKERHDFAESAGGAAQERVQGFVLVDKAGFDIAILGRGRERVKSLDDVGGALCIQLRHGIKNAEGDPSPVFFRYNCMRQPRPVPRAYGAFYGLTDAEATRNPRSRFHRVTPAYVSSQARGVQPSATFYSMPDGWCIVFHFAWYRFFDMLPYQPSENPVSWRLVAERVRADGSVATWGSLADPVALSWPRAGAKFAEELRRDMVMNRDVFGIGFRDKLYEQDFRWRAYKKERYIGFFDPGVKTFEQKNPESDEVFYTKCMAPLLATDKALDEALYYNPIAREMKDLVRFPPVVNLPTTKFYELYSQLGRVLFSEEVFDAMRRDYLLARFTDGPLPAPPPREDDALKAAPPPKKKKSTVPTLDEDEAAGGKAIIELDDISF